MIGSWLIICMEDDLMKEVSECDKSTEIWMILEIYIASH